MGKKIFSLLAVVMFVTSAAIAQVKVVTGTVTDGETGDPLVGAVVRVQGTNKGVITDMHGNYKLTDIPANAKNLQISFTGMQTLQVAIAPTVNAVMTSNNKMNQVMVVAYGTATRSSFTGSAAVVGSEQIESHTVSNVTSALAGTTAGVQMTSSNGDPTSNAPTIRIRGIGSINATNGPLFIVDGVPYDGPINAINPNDVESMTVLKDASASAIYGARGANGVIVITTKKGTSNKADIKFEAKWGSNSRLIPQYDVISSAGQYYEHFFKRLYNSNIMSGMNSNEAYLNANERMFTNDGGLGYQVYTLPEGENLIGTNFRLNPNAKLGYSDGEYFYTPDNWYDAAFHNSLRQEYNLSASGTSGNLNYYAGAGYLQDEGIVNNSGMKRYNGRLNADYKVRSWLKLGTNMNFAHTVGKQPMYTSSHASSGNLFYICNNIAPIYPLYVRDASGQIMTDGGRIIYDANQTNFKRASLVGNAVRDNELNLDQYYRDVFTGNWYATVSPVKGLTVTASIGITSDNLRSNASDSPFGSASNVDGQVSVRHERLFSVNNQYIANYKTDFKGSKHNLDVMVGYEQYQKKIQYLRGLNDHMYAPFISELGNALGHDYEDAQSYTTNYMTSGILSRVQYDYDGKYFVNGSYRRDASSRFAPGHRWGNFGSAGFAWLMNKENFMRNAQWIDMLKFKLSYGLSGNDGLGNYFVYADMYETSYNPETGQYSNIMIQKGNNELTWEGSHAFNVGFDFNFLNNRLNGSIEYFGRVTTDMLFYKDFPLSAGYGTSIQLPVNVGSVINHGIEIQLEGVAIRTKDLEWALNLNMTHYKNEILKLDDQYAEEGIKYSSSILKEGGSIYQTYMYKYAGVDKSNGKPMFYKELEDGTITTTNDATEATRFDCGSTLPTLYGGFGTTLKYKGLDISAQFSYQLGGKIYDGAYQSLMWTQDQKGSNMHTDLLNSWSPSNPDSNIPVWANNGWGNLSQSACDFFLTSSNYLSINNVTIGYTMPSKYTKKLKLGSLRFFVTGENLAVFSARKGLDPRFSMGTGSMTSGSGLSSDYYSAMRNVTGGVSITF